MAKYLSNRQQNLKIGINSYTENQTVLEVTGKVGIGTTNPTQKLHVVGNAYITGALYASGVNGISTSGTSGQVLQSVGTGISWVSLSTGGSVSISTNTTNQDQYLTYVTGTGSTTGFGVSTTNFTFNPSTGDAKISGLTIGKGTGSVSSNTALGYQALNANTTGVRNTAVGYQALYSNTNQFNNTANGYNSLRNSTAGGCTAIGAYALSDNSSWYSTATGYNALRFNTSGSRNTANGYAALTSNITGRNNTANGYYSLYSNVDGYNLTANGAYALYFNTNGYNNTANGYYSLYSNTTGASNTANGYYSLYSNTTGARNTATGYDSLRSNTNGYNNTATGGQALNSNTTGASNTANGYYSLYSNTTGTANTATGGQALNSNTTGASNTATGYQALNSNTTGTANTATGNQALQGNTTGTSNTATGYQAGNTITTGSNNSFLGYNAQPSSATVSNEITLGDTNVNTLRVPGLGYYGVRTNTTFATTSATTIDSIVVATYRSARIQIQITQGRNYQVSDVLLIHDGTTASIIEYGTLATGSTLGTYSATISSGNALLQVAMSSATSSTVKVLSCRTVV